MKEKLLDSIIGLLIRFFGDKILISINKRIFIDIWRTSFESAVTNVSFFRKGVGEELAFHRGILRFYFATFYELNVNVSVENLAIAIAMELYSYDKKIDSIYIYDLAEAVLKNWHKFLSNNNYFNEKYSERIKSIQYKKDACAIEQTLNIINSRDKVYREYFKSYNCDYASTKIRIWLPRPNETWIRWETEHSLEISVNPMIGFELGFFRVGFDYSHITNNEKGNLRLVYYSNSSFREGAEFSTIRIGETSGNVIWVY